MDCDMTVTVTSDLRHVHKSTVLCLEKIQASSMSVRNLLKIQCNVMNLCLTVTNDNNGKIYGETAAEGHIESDKTHTQL